MRPSAFCAVTLTRMVFALIDLLQDVRLLVGAADERAAPAVRVAAPPGVVVVGRVACPRAFLGGERRADLRRACDRWAAACSSAGPWSRRFRCPFRRAWPRRARPSGPGAPAVRACACVVSWVSPLCWSFRAQQGGGYPLATLVNRSAALPHASLTGLRATAQLRGRAFARRRADPSRWIHPLEESRSWKGLVEPRGGVPNRSPSPPRRARGVLGGRRFRGVITAACPSAS